MDAMLLLLGALGCASGCSGSPFRCTPTDGGIDAPASVALRCGGAGAAPCDTQVITRLLLPASATEAKSYAYDQDDNGTVDNALGSLLAALRGLSGRLDLAQSMNAELLAGDAINLIRRQRASGGAEGAGQWILGRPRRCCDVPRALDECRKQARQRCFSGSATFAVESASDGMVASTRGLLTAYGPGPAAIRLPIEPAWPTTIRVRQLRFEWPSTRDGEAAEGRVHGVIPADEVRTKIVPAMARLFDSSFRSAATESRSTTQWLNLFDRDGDGRVSTREFADNDLVQTFFAGDIDLDGDCDNGLSFGFGFSSVPAKLP